MQLPSLHWKPPIRGEQRGHVTERRAVIGHLEAGRLLLAGEALGAGGGGDLGLGRGGHVVGGGHEAARGVEAHPGAQVAGVGQLPQGAPSAGVGRGLVRGRHHPSPLLDRVLEHFCGNCTEILLTRLKPGAQHQTGFQRGIVFLSLKIKTENFKSALGN